MKIRILAALLLVGLAAPLAAQTTISGSKGPNVSPPSTTKNLPTMPAIACSTQQSLTAGRVVFPCVDVYGSWWVVLKKSDGTDVSYIANGQAVKASSQPVTLASDQPPVPGTLKSGAITSAMTGTTSTVVIAAQASNYLYVSQCTASNASTTVSTDILLQDGSGGTTLYVIPAPAAAVTTTGGGGGTFVFPSPLKVPTLGNALYVANVTTGSSTKVSCSGFYSTASY